MSEFVISLSALEANARVLADVARRSGARIVLALKGFSCWHAFAAIRPHLDGCCASGLWEAELAREHFGKHVLTYSPAYRDAEIPRLLEISDHLDFNSLSQWERFRDTVMAHPRYLAGEVSCGLRVNPECSTGHTALYDPCAPGSRLGITADALREADARGLLAGISGVHFHTLCEQGADDLETTLRAVEKNFAWLLERPEIRWLNMGGGHWITKPNYDRALLVELVRGFRAKYGLEVWLEPGEAVAIHTGVLRATVLDVFATPGHQQAILDVSTTAHMPDVLEMPYRPDVFLAEPGELAEGDSARPAVVFPGETYTLAGQPGQDPALPHVYRLGASTCLAGDVCGDFAFPRPLVAGDTLVFDDMAHYTMVKTTMFNGVAHPDITLQHADSSLEIARQFTYSDFAGRLG